jgi:DNA-binding transcriptional MerR regulator
MRSVDEKQNVNKIYFRIGEISRILGVETSVIRYWESEYPGLRPRRSKTGQRVYTQKDLKRLEQIKQLRYERGFTTRGALQVLRTKGLEEREPNDPLVVENERMRESLLDLRASILEFLDDLEQEGSPT